MQHRRPLWIIALGSWFMAGLWLAPSGLWLIVIGLLLSFRYPKSWLWLLIIIRLGLMLPPEPLDYMGEVEIQPLSYGQSDQWRVRLDRADYLYRGPVAGSGLYRVQASFSNFRRIRNYRAQSEHDYYRAKGLVAEIEFQELERVEAQSPRFAYRLQAALYRQLSGFTSSQNIAYALLFGGQQLLDKPLHRDLAKLGILHMMVVSGLHLSIYERRIDRVLSGLRCPRLLRRIISLCIFGFLLIITDFHPSCLRSVLIRIFREYCFIRKRPSDSLDHLAAATWLMLLINPFWATHTGFILGTLAHLALTLPARASIIRLYLVMLPFQLMLNGVLSPFYLVLNLGLAAIMPWVLPVLAISVLIKPLQILGHTFLQGLQLILLKLEAWDILKLDVFMPAPAVILIILLFYSLWLLRLQDQARYLQYQAAKWKLGVIALTLIISGQWLHTAAQVGVHFLDVGQGDATIIITQRGKSILIDSSKSDRLWEHMRYLGIRQFDLIFITHRDDDHSYWVDELNFVQGYTSAHTPMPGLLPLRKGDEITLDEWTFEVLHPGKKAGSENDNSLVLRAEQYGLHYLWAGDVSKKVLQSEWLEQSDIYKYPHHGSIHSLLPTHYPQNDQKLVIFSYGRNHYQHPHPEVVALFSEVPQHHSYWHGSLHIYKSRIRRH